MRTAIYGAGSLGTILGAYISKAGIGIELINRKGKTVRLKMQRHVRALSAAELPESKWNLRTAGYTSVDEWIPLDAISTDEALLCAWSLEQFPGAEGIIGFGKCRNTADCLNDDFYGSVAERTSYTENSWIFRLGGPKRLQIGVKANQIAVGILVVHGGVDGVTNINDRLLAAADETGGQHQNGQDQCDILFHNSFPFIPKGVC